MSAREWPAIYWRIRPTIEPLHAAWVACNPLAHLPCREPFLSCPRVSRMTSTCASDLISSMVRIAPFVREWTAIFQATAQCKVEQVPR